ncbi:MAG: SdpI family protein [Muriicola sp.]
MTFSNSLFLGCLFVGIAFLLMGNLLRIFPPKKVNRWYGYRTSSSMRSQERWDFAQIIAAKEMIKQGFLLTLFGIFTGFFFHFDEMTNVILIVSLVLVSSIAMIYFTERALKKNF